MSRLSRVVMRAIEFIINCSYSRCTLSLRGHREMVIVSLVQYWVMQIVDVMFHVNN